MDRNKPKKKGTAFETEVLRRLQAIWPEADRAKANNRSNDIVGVPFPVECKHRHRWELKDWIRRVRAVDPDNWLIVVADGDRRKADAIPGEVAVVPFGHYLTLWQLAHYWKRKAEQRGWTVPDDGFPESMD